MKLVDKFNCLGSSVSSTETDIDTRVAKAGTARRTRHAGHCVRRKDKLINDKPTWVPSRGREKSWRPARTYIQQLWANTRYTLKDLPRAMDARDGEGKGVSGRSMLVAQHDDDYDEEWYYLTQSYELGVVHMFLRSINLKVNVVAWLDFELTHYDVSP